MTKVEELAAFVNDLLVFENDLCEDDQEKGGQFQVKNEFDAMDV